MSAGDPTNNMPSSISNDAMCAEFLTDPVVFFYSTWVNYTRETGFKLARWQEEVLRAVAQKNFLAVTGCNDSGKTAIASLVILWFMSTRPNPIVGVTSVDQIQLNTVLWTELRRWYERSPTLVSTFELRATRLRHRLFPDTWFAVPRTARRQSDTDAGPGHSAGLQGLHSEHLLYVIDESSGVDDSNWDSAQSSIRHPDNRIFAISNPLKLSGRMFEIFHVPAYRKYWYTRNVSYKECPWIDKTMAAVQIEALGGESSPVVQARFLGQFPKAGAFNTLPSYESVSAAMARGRELDAQAISVLIDCFSAGIVQSSPFELDELKALQERLSDVQPGSYFPEDIYSAKVVGNPATKSLLVKWERCRAEYFTGPCILGVDLARFGANETAFAVRRGWRIVEVTGFTGLRQGDILGRIKNYFVRYPGLHLAIVDATGIAGGMGVVDPLIDAGYNCVAVNFGGAACNVDRYANCISELWLGNVGENISRIVLPTDDMLLSQFTTREYEFTGKNSSQIRIQPKKQMVAVSPDRAEAVCMAFATVSYTKLGEEGTFDDQYENEITEPTEEGVFSF